MIDPRKKKASASPLPKSTDMHVVRRSAVNARSAASPAK